MLISSIHFIHEKNIIGIIFVKEIILDTANLIHRSIFKRESHIACPGNS